MIWWCVVAAWAVDPADDPADDPAGDPAGERPICATCDVDNEPDARFCKGCGASLGSAT